MANILVVVDYQNDFVTGSLGFSAAEKIKDGIVEKIREFGKRGDYVICTQDTIIIIIFRLLRVRIFLSYIV